MRISDVTIGVVSRNEESEEPVLEYRWLARGADGAPVAHHRLRLLEREWFADSASFARAVAGGTPPVAAATGWPARWTAETRPAIVRPDAPDGRRLDLTTLRAGLRLIERGLDADGAPVIEHEAVILTGCPVEGQRLRAAPLSRPPAHAA
jgi:hypothetical protein